MPFSRRCRIPSLFLWCTGVTSLALVCGAQPSKKVSPDDLSKLLQRQIGMDDDLPGEQNPTGLRFHFLKIDEVTLSQGSTTRYRAYTVGAPVNKQYALGVWKIGSDLQILAGEVYVNAKGLLMVHKPRPDQETKDSVEDADELDLAVQAARGEPIRFVLASTDGSLIIPGTVVPFPIEGKDKNCRLEIRLATPSAEAILIYADGLPPNADVPFQSNSAGELEQAKFSANANGHAVTADLPYVDGKESGVLKATLATKDCTVSVEIPWGKGTYHPL